MELIDNVEDEIMYDIFPVIEKVNIIRTDEEIFNLYKDSDKDGNIRFIDADVYRKGGKLLFRDRT